MKEKTLFISSIVIAFVFGVLSTYLFMTKQQMDQVMLGRQQAATSLQDDTDSSFRQEDGKLSEELQALEKQNGNNMPATKSPQTGSMHDYSQEQAMDIVNKMPDYMLGQYIDRFMSQGAGEALVDKNATIFAHLDTAGKVPASPFVFVKWVNNQTGQVLLFEKKDIVANSNQNWVSFKPDDGWTQGSYDIRFYQFTSELQPVAQLTYQIYNVDETNSNADNGMTSGAVAVTTATVKK